MHASHKYCDYSNTLFSFVYFKDYKLQKVGGMLCPSPFRVDSRENVIQWWPRFMCARHAHHLLLLQGHCSVMLAMLWSTNMVAINDSENNSSRSCQAAALPGTKSRYYTVSLQMLIEWKRMHAVVSLTTATPNLVGFIFTVGEAGNMEKETWQVILAAMWY